MGEDTRLVNIYLKIHNKQPLFLDDLRYLAKYDPECFEKTCRNVVYNLPETQGIMEPVLRPAERAEKPVSSPATKESRKEQEEGSHAKQRSKIEEILANLKRLERDELPNGEFDAERVKNLLANLYMEQIFPHNDKDTFMETNPAKKSSFFDKKI